VSARHTGEVKRPVWFAVTCVSALSAAGCTSGHTASPTTTSATSSTGASAPTLGRPAGIFAQGSEGFGAVRPTVISNGGDPTGVVSHVVWTSWGGAQAKGSGNSDYVGPDQDVASGSQESATVIAFKLGSCNGTLMYQAVEWYFPQHGQSFDPNSYEDICTGTYVPSS
jgi:hypothetical protein